MVKLIKIGEPVNEAEMWAFEFLKSNSSDEYLLVTNEEIPTPNGQRKKLMRLFLGETLSI